MPTARSLNRLTCAAAVAGLLGISGCASMTDEDWDTFMLVGDIAVLVVALDNDCYSTRDAYGYERYSCYGDHDRRYTRGPGRHRPDGGHRPHKPRD